MKIILKSPKMCL